MLIKPTKKFWIPSAATFGSVASGGGGGGNAPQTTAFLARTSGLSGPETAAYTALINGLVSDGVFSLLDALYIFATNNTTTAVLNLVSTNFTITPNGTLTFTADTGWAADGSTGFLNTGFKPSTAGGNFSLNSGSLFSYDRTPSASVTITIGNIGAANTANTAHSWIVPRGGSNGIFYDINENNIPNPSVGSQGFLVASRTASNLISLYSNGNPAPVATDTGSSVSLVDNNLLIAATGDGSGNPTFLSPNQYAAAGIGGGLSSAQATALSNRINAYMTALGANVF